MRSELHSPLVKRKAKEKVKQSEKENEEVVTSNNTSNNVTSNNTKSPRKQQRPIHNNNNKPNATSPVKTQKSRDFTVDIFTSKSSEAKEGEEEKKQEVEEVEEGTKKVGGGSVTAAEKVHHCHLSLSL